MDPQLKEHLEDIFELFVEVHACLEFLRLKGTQGMDVQAKMDELKARIAQAAEAGDLKAEM